MCVYFQMTTMIKYSVLKIFDSVKICIMLHLCHREYIVAKPTLRLQCEISVSDKLVRHAKFRQKI